MVNADRGPFLDELVRSIATASTRRAFAKGVAATLGALALGGTGRVAAQGCPAGQVDCGGVCTDPNWDVSNCGDCGVACSQDQTCRYSVCEQLGGCESWQTDCAGYCTDVSSDVSHCGVCFNVCPQGMACVDGTCQGEAGCQSWQTDCGGYCTDLGSDNSHCGQCFNTCPYGRTCIVGSCQKPSGCADGFVDCGGYCADLTADASNCGDCGAVCPTGKCEGGQCVSPCPPGQALCGGDGCQTAADCCVDLLNDSYNCGACSHVCAAGQTCTNGGCKSPQIVPLTPGNVRATVLNAGSVRIDWNDVDGETGYRVTNNVSGSAPATVGAGTTSYTFSGMTSGTYHCYAVQAYNDAGFSPWSGNVCTSTQSQTAPTTPGNVQATVLDAGSIRIDWNNVEGETGYRVTNNVSGSTPATVGTGITSYTFSRMSAGTYHCYAVQAYNDAGASSWSEMVCVSTQSQAVPAAPGNVRATALDTSSVRIDWNDVDGETGFRVTNNVTGSTPAPVGAGVTSYTFGGMPPNMYHCYAVQAYNDAGSSPWSGMVCTSTQSPCPSGQDRCSDTCRDLRSDSSNCGACGHRCESGQTCSNRTCTGGGGSVDDFFSRWNGKPIDFDGAYPGQCMDLYHQYNQDVVHGANIKAGHAAWVWEQNLFDQDKYYKIPNTPTGVPMKGDIVVWSGDINGGIGHIAIFSSGDANSFTSFDQNFPTGSPPHMQTHSYTAVYGWLRRK